MLFSGFVRCALVLLCACTLSCNGSGDDGASGGSGSSDCEWRIVETRTEIGCGTPNPQCTIKAFDERGFEIGSHIDRGCDGTKEFNCETHTLDAMGRKVLTRREDDCDGVVNDCIEYTYAANGEVSEREDDCAGGPPTCRKYLNDADGRELSWESDDGCDGPESCRTHSYDEKGRPLMSQHGDCGAPNTCLSYEYDADGTKSRVESDDGCDGVPEECSENTYDADGKIIHHDGFADCSSDTATSCTDHPVDEHGNVVGIEFDANCDGTPDNCAYHKYECFE